MEDEDPVVPVVITVIIILFLILSIRILWYCLWGRESGNREDDVEHLDPSIEFENGCGSFNKIFTCCFETEREDSLGGQLSPPLQLQSSPQRSVDLHARPELQIVNENDVKVVIKRLEALQGATDSKPERLKIIRLVQNILLLHEERPSGTRLQTALIIGVDATPKVAGGYCVNLHEMRLDYYVIKMEDFPWPLEAENNPSEFEMKNLIFALATWSKLIRKYSTFRIYTDNQAIASNNSEFGLDARDLLDHFTECGNAKLVSQQMHINRTQDLARFAKFIQPADDFSRWEVDKGIDFLCGFYGIDKGKVHGTMKLMRNATPDSKAWYDPSPAYSQYVMRAETFARNFRCENCVIDTFASAQHSTTGNGDRGGRGNRNKLRRLQQTPRGVLGNNGNNRGGNLPGRRQN